MLRAGEHDQADVVVSEEAGAPRGLVLRARAAIQGEEDEGDQVAGGGEVQGEREPWDGDLGALQG